MIHINTTSLAFYTNKAHQSHRLSYAHGNIFSLLSGVSKILPFQVILEKGNTIVDVNIYNKNDGFVRNITSFFTNNSIIHTFDDYDVLSFSGNGNLTTALPEGTYYLEITLSALTLYSELFNAVKTVRASEIVEISFWDNADFIFQHTPGRIVYSAGFRNKLYLCTKLSKPNYELEEVVEDRDGFKFVEKQIQKKLLRFSFLATEYLCDVLAIIGMHDNIIINHNNRIYNVYDILFTPEWQEEGFVANVDAEFTTDAIIKKIGRLFPKHNLGDYNSDFSNDFNVL